MAYKRKRMTLDTAVGDIFLTKGPMYQLCVNYSMPFITAEMTSQQKAKVGNILDNLLYNMGSERYISKVVDKKMSTTALTEAEMQGLMEVLHKTSIDDWNWLWQAYTDHSYSALDNFFVSRVFTDASKEIGEKVNNSVKAGNRNLLEKDEETNDDKRRLANTNNNVENKISHSSNVGENDENNIHIGNQNNVNSNSSKNMSNNQEDGSETNQLYGNNGAYSNADKKINANTSLGVNINEDGSVSNQISEDKDAKKIKDASQNDAVESNVLSGTQEQLEANELKKDAKKFQKEETGDVENGNENSSLIRENTTTQTEHGSTAGRTPMELIRETYSRLEDNGFFFNLLTQVLEFLTIPYIEI